MARRRLNTKLFAIVLGVLVLGGGVALAWKLIGRPLSDPAKIEADADAALAAGREWEAITNYRRAIDAAPNNPSPKRKLGEAFIRLRPELVTDPAFPGSLNNPINRVGEAHRAWRGRRPVRPKPSRHPPRHRAADWFDVGRRRSQLARNDGRAPSVGREIVGVGSQQRFSGDHAARGDGAPLAQRPGGAAGAVRSQRESACGAGGPKIRPTPRRRSSSRR